VAWGAPSIFRWIETRIIHYGDAPPIGTLADEYRFQRGQLFLVDELGDADGRDRPEVLLLTGSDCRQCQSLRNHLERRQVPYREFDVEATETGKVFYESLRGAGLPLFMVGTEGIGGGYDHLTVSRLLDQAGY
jgi:glutaredoxin